MKALALVEAPDHVCCRYRVRAFAPALAAAGWSVAIEGLEPGARGRLRQFRRAAHVDTVLLQRRLLPPWQLYLLRRCARRLIFDFDDAVLYRDSYHRRGPYSRRRAGRFAGTVRLADRVLAGNAFLADCALKAGARPERVQMLPTCVAPERYPMASHSFADERSLELVWIGSSCTLQGLERQRSLFERLGREIPRLRLRVICDRFPRFDALETAAVPWSEASEAAALAEADVGISWVPDDLWSRGKCGLKILQYQAAGLPVVANPVGVQGSLVRHEIDGFLAATPEEWIAALQTLADRPDLRGRMGRAGRASVEANGSVAAWAPAFVAAIAG
jgi:glycosyltransferase involved in cell wall biosynthesis